MALSVDFGANISGLTSGISQATSQLNTFVSSANSRLQSFGDNISNIGQKMSLAFSVPLGLIGTQALKTSANFEQTQIAFETMLGSASKASYLIQELQTQASKSPLEEKDLQQSAKTLLNFGVAGNSVLPILNQLSDVSQGNAERFSGLSLAFGQMSSTGRLMGQDLNQMINAGFNPLQEISRTTGQSMSSLKKQMEDGGISVGMVSEAFKTATSEGGRFYGSTEKQSKSLAGLYSSMQDSIGKSLKGLGDDISTALNLKEIIPQIGAFIANISNAFSDLDPNVKKAVLVFGGLLVVIPPILAGIGALIPVFAALSAGIALVSAPVLAVGAGIAGLAYIVTTNWTEIKNYLTETGIWDGLALIVQNTFGVIKGVFTTTISFIKSVWNSGLSIIESDTFGIFGVISGIVSGALQFIGGAIGVFSNLLQGNWSGLFVSLKNTMGGAYNAMISITEGFTVAIVGTFQKIFEFFGADKIVNQFKQATDSIKKQFEGFKYKVELDKTETTTKKVGTKLDSDLGSDKNNGKKELTEDELKAQSKAQKDKEKLQAEYLKNSTKLLSDALKIENGLISDKYLRELAQEKQSYEEKIKSANQEKASTESKHRILEALEREHQSNLAKIVSEGMQGRSAISGDGGLQGIGTKNISTALNVGNPLGGLTDKLNQTLPNVVSKIDSVTGQLSPKMQQMKGIFEGLNTSIQSSLQDATASAFTGLGTVFGAMIAGNASIGDAGQAIMGVIGNVFGQMGEMFSKAGVALLLLEPLVTNPFTSGAGMILAGVALSALSGAISSSVSSGGSGSSSSGASSYAQNYSSGASSYGGGSSFGGGEKNQVFTINLTGKLTADGNDLSHSLDRTIRQKARTYGG